MYSIYGYFADLVKNREQLRSRPLEDFPLNRDMLSCSNKGKFPDQAIKVNPPGSGIVGGGELIELKSTLSYTIASFNSTIPRGEKSLTEITKGKKDSILRQMAEAGYSTELPLPFRPVYYLIRGRESNKEGAPIKVCLVHGSFFETFPPSELIKRAFEKAFRERLVEANLLRVITPDQVRQLCEAFTEQHTFSRTRHVAGASVGLRFRIMTQVSSEGNILKNDSIKANTLNFVAPIEPPQSEALHYREINKALKESGGRILPLRSDHRIKRLNGDFFLMQVEIP